MEHKEEAVSTLSRDDEARSGKAEIAERGAGAEYFNRYEKRRGGEERMEDSKDDYWLSEDEEVDSHQLKRQKWKSRIKRELYVVQDAKAPKLRPAEDVLKRLRWDSSLNITDFTIGYLERFEGIKEMPMSMWVRETTDGDFIPQHRIKYLKRNSDGEVVWDQEGRIDKIFGSGLTGKVADESEEEEEEEDPPVMQCQTTVSGGEAAEPHITTRASQKYITSLLVRRDALCNGTTS